MIEYLLDLRIFTTALIVLAIATPVLALAVHRWRPTLLPSRIAMVCGAFGPFAALYWLFHNAVLAWLGFDRIVSAALVVLIPAVIGLVAGIWAGRTHAPKLPSTEPEE